VVAFLAVAAAAQQLQILEGRHATEPKREDVVVLDVKGAAALHALACWALTSSIFVCGQRGRKTFWPERTAQRPVNSPVTVQGSLTSSTLLSSRNLTNRRPHGDSR
jgi:hypothetical protein